MVQGINHQFCQLFRSLYAGHSMNPKTPSASPSSYNVSFLLKAIYSNNIQIYYGYYKVVHNKTLKFKRTCLNKETTKQIMAETLGTEVRIGT